jgi:protein SCO1/2
MSKIIILFLVQFAVHIQQTYASDSELNFPKGGDFSVTSSQNKTIHLSDFKGKIVFLYFGYTQCPTVCPFTNARLKKLAKELKKKNVTDLHFLFISIDQARDHLKKLNDYQINSGPLFTVATSTNEELKKIVSLFGGYFSKITNPAGDLIIDHSSNIYVINQKSEWIKTISYKSAYEDYLNAYLEAKDETQKPQFSNTQFRNMEEIKLESVCLLDHSACEVSLPDKSKIKIDLSNRPIKTENPFTVNVQLSSSVYKPELMDFVGVEQNMGLIRPELTLQKSQSFLAKVNLPLCENKKMTWKIRLILKDAFSKLSFIKLNLTTLE